MIMIKRGIIQETPIEVFHQRLPGGIGMRRRSASGRGSNIGSVVYRLSSLKYVFPIFVSPLDNKLLLCEHAPTSNYTPNVNSRTGDSWMTTQQHTESFLAGYRKESMLLFSWTCTCTILFTPVIIWQCYRITLPNDSRHDNYIR